MYSSEKLNKLHKYRNDAMIKKKIKGMTDLGKPVETVGGVDKVQGSIREKSAIKGTRVSSHENGRRRGSFGVLPEQGEEIREGLEDGVEVIGGKIIEVHPQLRSRVMDLVAYALYGLKYVSDD